MALLKSHCILEFKITVTLNEEARAFEALTSYDTDEFIKVFYKYMGSSYLQPHEKGLRLLSETMRNGIKFHLLKIDKIYKTFNEG